MVMAAQGGQKCNGHIFRFQPSTSLMINNATCNLLSVRTGNIDARELPEGDAQQSDISYPHIKRYELQRLGKLAAYYVMSLNL